MNWNRDVGNWTELVGNLERRWHKLIARQLTLWSGTRDRTKQLAESRARQEEIERPK